MLCLSAVVASYSALLFHHSSSFGDNWRITEKIIGTLLCCAVYICGVQPHLFVICVPCPRSYCSLCYVNLYVLLLLLLLLLLHLGLFKFTFFCVFISVILLHRELGLFYVFYCELHCQ